MLNTTFHRMAVAMVRTTERTGSCEGSRTHFYCEKLNSYGQQFCGGKFPYSAAHGILTFDMSSAYGVAHFHKSLTFCISGDVISFRGSLGNEYFLEGESDKR